MRPTKKAVVAVSEKTVSKLENQNVQHVNEYIEYCNLVGDNGGLVMSEKEFTEYKKNHAKQA